MFDYLRIILLSSPPDVKARIIDVPSQERTSMLNVLAHSGLRHALTTRLTCQKGEPQIETGFLTWQCNKIPHTTLIYCCERMGLMHGEC